MFKPNYIIIPLITVLVSVVGSLLTSSGMSWYRTIKLPSWTPAGAVIGTVWTVIFILSAISALVVWNSQQDSRFWWIIGIFIANAVINVIWSLLFFNQHLIGAAVLDAALLDITVIALIVLIWPISRLAATLLLPYAGWVAFATYLNYTIWLLNR